MRGSEMAGGYGRIFLQFDDAPRVTARVSNGVLIVNFGDKVTVAADRIIRELPSFLSVVRIDPDGRGMRFALLKPMRVNLMEAGEKVFIDLLPENWQGQMPNLPKDVLEELAERVRIAESKAREVQRRKEAEEPKQLAVRASNLPTLTRLVFDTPATTPISHKVTDGSIDVTFDLPLQLEAGKLRPLLPQGAILDSLEAKAGLLQLKLTAPDGWQIRAFREDDGFVIDMARPAPKGAAESEAKAPEPARPNPKTAAKAPAKETAKPVAAAAPAIPAPVQQGMEAVSAKPAADVAPVAEENLGPRPVSVKAAMAAEGGRIDFGFPRKTAAAAFETGGIVTLVFDTVDQLDPASLKDVLTPVVASTSVEKQGKATVVRLALSSPQVMRMASDGMTWSLTLGENGVAAAQSLVPRRSVDEGGQTIVAVPLTGVTGVHWIDTDGRGQPMAVATAFGQAKAIAKPQRFVEFRLPQTAHGLAVVAGADDIVVRTSVDDVVVARNGGLTVSLASSAAPAGEEAAAKVKPVADRDSWMAMRTGSTRERAREVARETGSAAKAHKSEGRLRLATFLIANDLAAEAVGPLNAVWGDDPAMRDNRRLQLLRVMAPALMHRHADAEAALAGERLKDDTEAGLWRALVDLRQKRFPKALAGFRRAQEVLDQYPDHLQALFRPAIIRAAVELRDFSVADRELQLLMDLPGDHIRRDETALLKALIDEANARPEAALAGYKSLFNSQIRPVQAEAQLRGVKLALQENDKSMPDEEALARLETVSAVWRGDALEVVALGELGRLYADRQRWREAFMIAKQANVSFPDEPVTRRMHDETAAMFEELFTSGRSDTLPRVEALALFYDFKEFLPIGRRGDEIIRRLADRLVELDLLDQAGELLRHQMENRLTGAARSTLAARLAMIRLMNGKPAEALAALASTRLPELPGDVKRARLLLEAKALSDLSRTDLALEILTGEKGPEIERLKADILWSGRRWREAGEAHERILGDAWRGDRLLADRERADVMRAGVAYVMADEALSLDRLRTKFAAKMADSADARTFAFVTSANRGRASDTRELAKSVSGSDTISEFMIEYRKRYPDFASSVKHKAKPEGQTEPPARPAANPAAGAAAGSATPAPAQGGRG